MTRTSKLDGLVSNNMYGYWILLIGWVVVHLVEGLVILREGILDHLSNDLLKITQSYYHQNEGEDRTEELELGIEYYGKSGNGKEPGSRFGKQFGGEYGFVKWVDVFYGTFEGHTFPGTAVPFSMCKMGVDVVNSRKGDAYAGWQPDGDVVGVSMLHESGTGGAPTYGIVSQLPMMGSSAAEVDVSEHIMFKRSRADVAHVGYYDVALENGVEIEFSSMDRSGLYQYTFPQVEGEKPIVMVNVSQHLHCFGRPWWTQNFRGGFIKVDSNMKSYHGRVTIGGGWTDRGDYTISFYGEFDKPARRVVSFRNGKKLSGLRTMYSRTGVSDIGVLFEFDEGTTLLKSHVGISSSKRNGFKVAKQNLLNDYPSDEARFNLTWSVEHALALWNDKVFDKVVLDTTVEDPILVSKLYNSLYGTHLMPSNKSGADAPWKGDEPYYDDWFTLWDTFRCLHPLINIMSQDYGAEMVRSLINIWEEEGFTPDGRSGDRSGRTQGGSNSDVMMADAFVKNIMEGIDWEKGFQAMYTNAEVEPPYVEDPMANDSTNKFGRGALKEWLSLGYVTRNYSRSVTRTMEYSYNDFSLYMVAKGLGKNELAKRYLARSKNWRNIWNPEARSVNVQYNYTGFVQPRNADGTFASEKYDPFSCFGCYWGDDEYEGKPVEYGWTVPFDMGTLLEYIGSPETFERRLDDMYKLNGHENVVDIGNEPSFLTPYLYTYINKQDKTSELVNWIIDTKFKSGCDGLPGNSDAGAMQAWLTFALYGFYPIAGTDIYILTSPKFSRVVLQRMPNVPDGHIVAHDLYKDGGIVRSNYIREVVLNGERLNRSWFRHDELFGQGGTLEFYMSEVPLGWDHAAQTPPMGWE